MTCCVVEIRGKDCERLSLENPLYGDNEHVLLCDADGVLLNTARFNGWIKYAVEPAFMEFLELFRGFKKVVWSNSLDAVQRLRKALVEEDYTIRKPLVHRYLVGGFVDDSGEAYKDVRLIAHNPRRVFAFEDRPAGYTPFKHPYPGLVFEVNVGRLMEAWKDMATLLPDINFISG